MPPKSLKSEVAEDIHAFFSARERQETKEVLGKAIQIYAKIASTLVEWMEENIPEGLTVFSFPEKYRRRLRTTTCLERLSLEIRHRTRVVVLFSNADSCLRLITVTVIEISEEW